MLLVGRGCFSPAFPKGVACGGTASPGRHYRGTAPAVHEKPSGRPARPRDDDRGWPHRGRRPPRGGRAGDVPRRLRIPSRSSGDGDAGGARRSALHHRACSLQPRDQSGAAPVRRRLPLGDGAAAGRARGKSARRGAQARSRDCARRHPADVEEIGPGPREHDAGTALLRLEPGDEPSPGRRLRVPDEGHRRAHRKARLGDGRVLQHELSGPFPGRGAGVREAL